LAFGWLLTKPYISSVIAGATSASQVKSNVDASAWELTEEQMTIVNDISKR
jgi:aryl-alcohol dehydrogenase-like predicted oxidoreductase